MRGAAITGTDALAGATTVTAVSFGFVRQFFALGLLGAALTGCRVDLEVIVRAGQRASGVVQVHARLDEAAVTAVGSKPAALSTSDLAKVGWAVSGIRRLPAGGGEVAAERAFATVVQANEVLAQLSGPGGALLDLRLSRSHGLFATTLRLRGTADLSKGLAVFGDDQLKALLGSTSAVGFDDTEIARQTGAPVARAVRLRVTSDLEGSRVSRIVPFGGSLKLDASKRSISWIGPAGVGAMAIGVGGLVWLLRQRTSAVTSAATAGEAP